MDEISGFPRTETLKSGLAVTIRPLLPDDREKIAAAVRNLDRDSIYFRLFSYRKELTEQGLDRIMAVDSPRDVVLVVTHGEGTTERAVGSGRFVASDAKDADPTAEVAFMVDKDFHGQGLAGRLLKDLVAIARKRGITTLTAEVLADNKPMLAVFAKSGLPLSKRRDGGVVHVTLSLRGE
jgi:RimJ/RimL family protein N-acetyltransferase